MATGDFLRIARILPPDSTTGAVLLACYEGKDPEEVTVEEAETLIRKHAEAKSAAAGGK